MKRINLVRRNVCLLLIIVLIVNLCACTHDAKTIRITENENAFVVVSVQEEYILNTRTKKIHKYTCGTAKLIHEENRRYYEGTADELFDDGYSFCGNCFK